MTADPAADLREALERYVPTGFRDDDGVWHEGLSRAKARAALDVLAARLEALEAALKYIAESQPVSDDAATIHAVYTRVRGEARAVLAGLEDTQP